MDEKSPKLKVFIYGTLKKGESRAHVLEKQHFIGPAKTEKLYALHDLGSFPALAHSCSGKAIEGELWEIDEQCQKTLDWIEGSPRFYKSEPVKLSSHPNMHVESYFVQIDIKEYPECGTNWSSKIT